MWLCATKLLVNWWRRVPVRYTGSSLRQPWCCSGTWCWTNSNLMILYVYKTIWLFTSHRVVCQLFQVSHFYTVTFIRFTFRRKVWYTSWIANPQISIVPPNMTAHGGYDSYHSFFRNWSSDFTICRINAVVSSVQSDYPEIELLLLFFYFVYHHNHNREVGSDKLFNIIHTGYPQVMDMINIETRTTSYRWYYNLDSWIN